MRKPEGGVQTAFLIVDRYKTVLLNILIPDLQQRGCLQFTVFMQDRAPSYNELRIAYAGRFTAAFYKHLYNQSFILYLMAIPVA